MQAFFVQVTEFAHRQEKVTLPVSNLQCSFIWLFSSDCLGLLQPMNRSDVHFRKKLQICFLQSSK